MAQKIGKYEVIEELGRGAMGVVYKGKDPFIGRFVALKTITTGLQDQPELLQRFYREAQARRTSRWSFSRARTSRSTLPSSARSRSRKKSTTWCRWPAR
jgi:serine/threonine protein kinase